ncbi:hypothetical protein D3C78_1725160 [compost metagenome]
MVDCIFHNRLENELQYKQLMAALIHLNGVIQLILVACFLYLQVAADMIEFILKRNHFLPFAQTNTEQLG